MIFSAVITAAEEGGYVAFNPETGTTTQGETFDEAMANLREATDMRDSARSWIAHASHAQSLFLYDDAHDRAEAEQGDGVGRHWEEVDG